MARRKSRSTKRSSSRRSSRRSAPQKVRTRYVKVKSKRRHRRDGGLGGLKPSKHTMESWGLAGLYGYLEAKARADSSFVLNKVPKPIAQLGFTGNVAVVAWVGGHLAKSPWLKRFGNSVAHVAAYQLGNHGGAFGAGDEMFSVSGMPGISGPGDNTRLTPAQLQELAAAMSASVSGDEEMVEVESGE